MGLQFFPGIMESTHNRSPGALQHFADFFVRKTFNFSQEYDRFMRRRQLGKRCAKTFTQFFFLYLFIGISFNGIRNGLYARTLSLALFFTIKEGLAAFLLLPINR